jgi:hypothetical protein
MTDQIVWDATLLEVVFDAAGEPILHTDAALRRAMSARP